MGIDQDDFQNIYRVRTRHQIGQKIWNLPGVICSRQKLSTGMKCLASIKTVYPDKYRKKCATA